MTEPEAPPERAYVGDARLGLPGQADPSAMPLLEHLRELRTRLLWSVGALLLGMVVSLPLAGRLLSGLLDMCSVCVFIAVHPTETVFTAFRIAIVLGLVLATPVMLYQVVAFVSPGLLPRERRFLFIMLPGSGVMFALGLAFGYFVALPRAVDFLSGFMNWAAAPNWAVGAYVAFVMNLLAAIGVGFQTPLVVLLLARLRIVSPAFLAHYRRHAIVLMAIAAAVFTPTPDPFTMLLLLVPMWLLYEAGILLARLVYRHPTRQGD